MATLPSRLSLLAALLAAGPAFAERPANAEAIAQRNAQLAASRLMQARPEMGLDADHGFRMLRSGMDELGQTHTRFQKTYQGLKVWGGDLIVHTDETGRQLGLNAVHTERISLNTTPVITESEALAAAHRALAPKGPYAYEPTVELVVFPETLEIRRPGKASLRDQELNAEDMTRFVVRHVLAYHVHAQLENGAEETVHRDFMIDARTGRILTSWNTLHTTAATGTGNSQYSGTVSITTNSVTSGYEMRDTVRSMNIATYNLNHATSGQGTIYTDADNTWGDGANYVEGSSTTAANGQTAAVDAHYGTEVSFDFYNTVFGRNGIDGAGRATYNRVHYSNSYDNAFWDDTCFCMTYGDGSSFTTLTALDVAGHEMSHGVCANEANLTYSGESGGLNESNSDILGNTIEMYSRGGHAFPASVANTDNGWKLGEQLSATPLRYMFKPSKDGASPDAWSSSIGTKDVHYSSGPNNRMFFFLSQGASATSSSDYYSSYTPSGFTGIGLEKAVRIWYRALANYLTSSSNYAAARAACISAAKDLYGAGGAEEAAVWNAYAAINVGSAWTGGATAPSITSQPSSVTVTAPATATFSVTASGTAPLAYQWRKNGTAISGATSASYTTPATSSADNGATFSVVVSNSAGSVTSSNAVLTVNSSPTAPTITGQPSNATVAVGGTATFSVTASGTSPLSYQWQKNGVAISGATSASYTTPAATSADNGATFRCVVSNSAGSATSNNATLTVTTSGGTFNEVEPNDSVAAANVVGSSYTAIQGYHTATGNPDFFALTLSPGQKVTVNMTGPSGVDWDLKLVNSAGTQLAISQGSTATESVTYTNTGSSAMTVYADVYVYSGTSSSPYNLALSYVTPPPSVTYNEVESNNTQATANVVADTVTKIVGYIGSSTDNDYFKLNVGAGKTLAVAMTGPTGSSYDYDLYFYNASGTQLASGTGSTTTENVSWTNTGSSTAVVTVAVKRYAGSSTTTPYNLAISR
ncbi:MAG: M4 family metallopeptidase [Holophagaceae bacterium]